MLIQEDKIQSFILIDKFPTTNESLNSYLRTNKETLMRRKIRKFNETNWFEWGALRNYKKIRDNLGKDCIYIKTISRKETVAFVGKVQYFGGNLIILIPKEIHPWGSHLASPRPFQALEQMVSYLNGKSFRKNYTYSGRFKIGQRILSKVSLSNLGRDDPLREASISARRDR